MVKSSGSNCNARSNVCDWYEASNVCDKVYLDLYHHGIFVLSFHHADVAFDAA